VPFLKFSRDRRGYEHFCLVEPVSGRRGKLRERILYWFRTPPNVRVGRVPFDDHVMRALEAQYPGLRFDWEALRNTPIPSVEPEYWRERRRADRAVRRAQEEEEEETETASDQPTPEPPSVDGPRPEAVVIAISDAGSDASPDRVGATVATDPGVREEPAAGNSAGQRRHRRRRGHRQRGPVAGRAFGVPPDSARGGPEDL